MESEEIKKLKKWATIDTVASIILAASWATLGCLFHNGVFDNLIDEQRRALGFLAGISSTGTATFGACAFCNIRELKQKKKDNLTKE